MPLVNHPTGNYRFLPGIAPYSCGVVAMPGHEVVHVIFSEPLGYRAGFEKIEGFLDSQDRPRASLCSIELRSPKPFSFQGFGELNAEYAKILKSWGLFVDGVNPVARTNVSPEFLANPEVVIHGFAYTRPTEQHAKRTFVVAGGGELPDGFLDAESIVERGNLTPEGLRLKSEFVMNLMESRLFGLGGTWADVTSTNVYTIHGMDQIVPGVIAAKAGPAMLQGIRWFYTRPPIVEIEFEMDLRGVVHEIYLA
ncbi:MAG: RidA family protein [Planctomycetota bacterium]